MKKKAHHIFNHYIPKFILKNFATESYNNNKKISRVWVYDIKNNSFDFPETRKTMGMNKLYWDATQQDKSKLERDLNTKLEQNISTLFASKLYEMESEVELSREELSEIKRYMLAQITRVSFDKSYESFYSGSNGKEVFKIFNTMLKKQGRQTPIKDFSHLNEREMMLHDLRIIVETSFDKIHEHKDASICLLNHASFMKNAYLGFWKSDELNDFILTDTYLVNERDVMVPYKVNNQVIPIHAKTKIVMNVLEKYKEANEKKLTQEYVNLQRLCSVMVNMHETAWFFPITPNLSIVLINPFFKELTYNKLLRESIYLDNKNRIYTNIDLKYFEPNFAKYKRQEEIEKALGKGDIVSIVNFYSGDDKYIYKVHQLDKNTTQYINMLMLDRAANRLVIKSKSRITKSVKYYIDYDCTGKLKNYLPLYKKLREID